MRNIHVLPTDKPSRLIQAKNDILILLIELAENNEFNLNKHIYITSDEEIKYGYAFHLKTQEVLKVKGVGEKSNEIFHSKGFSYSAECKKIILTTDQDLIKDGVQAIDDGFLEWFIKNPKSENVYVYKEYKQVNQNNPVTRGSTALAFSHYEVQSLDLSSPIGTNEKEIMANLPNGDDFFKQETLEEAIKQELENHFFSNISEIKQAEYFINFGAKWQQEQDKNKFSEEEVLELLIKCPYVLPTDIKNWFEQFKKK